MKVVHVAWINPKILETMYIFAREGSLEMVFLDMGPSFD